MWLRLRQFQPKDFPVGTVVIAHKKHDLYPGIVVRHTPMNIILLTSDATHGIGRKDPDKCVPASVESFDDLNELHKLINWYNQKNKTSIQLTFK